MIGFGVLTAIILVGCSSLPPVHSDYTDIVELGKAIQSNMERDLSVVALEKSGFRYRSWREEVDGVRVWGCYICRNPEKMAIDQAKNEFAQFCADTRGLYDEINGICFRDSEPLWVARVIPTDKRPFPCYVSSDDALIINTLQPGSATQEQWKKWYSKAPMIEQNFYRNRQTVAEWEADYRRRVVEPKIRAETEKVKGMERILKGR